MQVIEFRRRFADNAPVPREVRNAIWRGTMDHGESLQVQARRHGVSHQQASSTPPAAPVARRAA